MCARSLIVVVALFLIATSGFASGQEQKKSESKLERAMKQASPAVVRVAEDRKSHSGVGAIFTPEGHIVVHGNPYFSTRTFFAFLSDGRSPKLRLLGWSNEWNLTILKIVEPGPWPHAPLLHANDSVRPDEPVFVAGYVLDKDGWRSKPEMQSGDVVRVCRDVWLKSTCRRKQEKGFYGFGPIFNANGQLIGNTGVIVDLVHVHAGQIRRIQKELDERAAINLDEKRLLRIHEEQARPYVVESFKDRPPRGAQKRAIASTVKIKSEEGRGSGVIVSPDGFIFTCAHGGDAPGDKATIHLSTGKSVQGVFLAVNPMTDIAIVKIKDKGRWPFSPIADSSHLPEKTLSWVIGYPGNRDNIAPLLRKTRLVYPKKDWTYQLFTDGGYDLIGGDSGGGVFDAQGRLLAIHQGKDFGAGTPGRHSRVETFRKQWPLLMRMGIGK